MRRELRDWLEELACRAGLDGLPRPAMLTAAAVGGLLVASALWRWGPWSAPGELGSAGETAGAASVPASIGAGLPSAAASVTVHVVGAVVRPGVYSIAAGSRACDAVAAAGGMRADAEGSAVNLARQVADGEQIVIPVRGAVSPAGSTPSGGGAGGTPQGGASGAKVNLNTADVAALDTLPGVGPATAQKIVADREANGPFRRVEDLMRVPGIGTKKFDALKDLVTTG